MLLVFLSTSLFSQTSGDYRTASGGFWIDHPWYGPGLSWEEYDGSSWGAADNPPETISTTVTILHSGVSIETATVNIISGGKIIIAPGKSLEVYATLNNNVDASAIVVQANSTSVGQFINNATISTSQELYVSEDAWHLIGSPFDGTNTTSTFDGAYMQEYNENGGTWTWNDDDDFNPYMDRGIGYSIWVDTSTEYTLTGSLTSTDVTLSDLPYDAEGYILFSNPYASGLKFTSDWERTGMNNSIWIWKQANGNYVSYDDGEGEVIPTSTGFIMKTNSTGKALTMKASNRRINNTSNIYKKEQEDLRKFAHLKIKNTNNNYQDIVKLIFKENANLDYNYETDAPKMYGLTESPNLFILTEDNIPVSIKGLDATQTTLLRMQLRTNVNATYRITASEFTFDSSTEVLIEDLFTSTIMTIDENLDYTFTSLADDIENRFRIYVTPSVNNINQPTIEDQFKIFGIDYQLHILSNENNYNLRVYNLLGQKLLQKNNIQGNSQLDLRVYQQKIIIVSLQTKVGIISKKIQLR
jgi:hypothetical protein